MNGQVEKSPEHGSRSSHSAVSSPPAVGFANGSGHKRKASSSQSSRSIKKLDYWQVDDLTGRHLHVHRDGTVTWRV
ncbi:hypothetical protein MMYC01_206282 [Madurella mycetomatis]|uniref:Uncharacterized protein n=1 Tax=Madurella mycetomatis TaxID=100816 RepID=A0A175W689_9PEZI|nr:hypothetical protein MMYC01_206282 [Madurella mycetomatis]